MDIKAREEGPNVILYTDGACSGNPGPGGWAAMLKDPATGKSREIFGSDPSTTNNRMELTAVIEGLKQLKKEDLEIRVVSDSKYVVQGITEWVRGWERNGWRTSDRKPVKNQDLWRELVELARSHRVTFEWVQAHNGHPENERVDALAVAAYQKYLK
ncbi:MAG: ribonuclease HI [Candidatus Eisenbacteria bacterium]|uniref:Ribonuclease H n=1 Tax=Eiseniibacteriota bacterium TaxID=2212470 RepID=A0A956LWG7_UNCEI|nr:ribonuclease HI [Candidatus Eisenbacteria bacterium]